MGLTKQTTYDQGRLSGAGIKIIAIISMIIDHVGGHIVRSWFVLSEYNIVTAENQSTSILIHTVIKVCDALGSIAFPLFCFLLAEGYVHTRDKRKYALTMLAFAFISEIPFNLVHRMRFFYPGLQNVMFTLAISIFTLYAAELIDEKTKGSRKKWLCRAAVIIAGMGLAFLVRGEYVFLGVLAITLFYYLREYKYLRLLAFVPLVVPSLWSLLALPAVMLYNGERGKQNKYFFYIFYPAHFLLIYAVMALLLKMGPEFFVG